MKSVEFTFAGIEFKVDLHLDDNNRCLDVLVGVSAWNKEKRQYEPISCNLSLFQKDMQDMINEAIEEMYESEKYIHADMMYDAWKEEQINWGNMPK